MCLKRELKGKPRPQAAARFYLTDVEINRFSEQLRDKSWPSDYNFNPKKKTIYNLILHNLGYSMVCL